ncbi:MAG: SpoIIE family protein phosphatase [Phycisphaerae bacterium]|nr:SpoIIE family protein phosphatase [Phycisphaerae bacterium]
MSYEEYGWEGLEPGAVIVVGTDGIWETRDPMGEQFGMDAFRQVVRTNAESSAAEMIDAVERALVDFRRDRPQEDDVTLVIAKVIG